MIFEAACTAARPRWSYVQFPNVRGEGAQPNHLNPDSVPEVEESVGISCPADSYRTHPVPRLRRSVDPLSAAATDFQLAKSGEFRIRYTIQVGTVPFKPSTATIRITCTPSNFRSFTNRSQNLAPSVCLIQRPSTSRVPSRPTARRQVDSLVVCSKIALLERRERLVDRRPIQRSGCQLLD